MLLKFNPCEGWLTNSVIPFAQVAIEQLIVAIIVIFIQVFNT